MYTYIHTYIQEGSLCTNASYSLIQHIHMFVPKMKFSRLLSVRTFFCAASTLLLIESNVTGALAATPSAPAPLPLAPLSSAPAPASRKTAPGNDV